MAVNNETGVIQDMPGLAAITKEAGALIHSDLAQAVGKIPLDLTGWKVDLASISGHKLYGPKGRRRAVRPPPPARPAVAAVLRWRAGEGSAVRHVAGTADRGAGRGLPLAGLEMAAEAERVSPVCGDGLLDRLRDGFPAFGSTEACRRGSPATST